MGSIRPLVTITILVVVGAYLYVKINEGPTPHAGAANQSSPATNAKGTSLAADNTAPAWPSTAATPAPPSRAAPSANQPLPPASTTASTSSTPKDGMPAVPAIPELPPLPTMNDPASSPTQQNIQLPKDLPANTPLARSPDQPGAAAAGAKEATGVAAPVVPPAISSTPTPTRWRARRSGSGSSPRPAPTWATTPTSPRGRCRPPAPPFRPAATTPAW